jgi:ribosomal protein L44E
MKYTVYQTTNLVNRKIYIGVHGTRNPDDGYIGSGKILKDAIARYGRKSFVKQVLFIFDNLEDAYEQEKQIVNESFVARSDTYNLTVGGSYSRPFDEERKELYSKRMTGENHPQYGKKQSVESNIKRSQTLTGRKMSKEAIEKSASARRGKPSPFKGSKRVYKNSLKGIHQSPESNAKRSEAHLRLAKITCANCGKEASPQNHTRWHGAKCKAINP